MLPGDLLDATIPSWLALWASHGAPGDVADAPSPATLVWP
jgi:hypothetical protein